MPEQDAMLSFALLSAGLRRAACHAGGAKTEITIACHGAEQCSDGRESRLLFFAPEQLPPPPIGAS